MFWVLVFMMMTLYSAAILCTRLIGHGDILPESLSTLFGTMSSWSLMKFVPLFDEVPLLRPVFVLFYIYSAWALLAVMTGVVSENMISIRDQLMKEGEERDEMRKTLITKFLLELFQEADVDNDGTG